MIDTHVSINYFDRILKKIMFTIRHSILYILEWETFGQAIPNKNKRRCRSLEDYVLEMN
jgi:hypothetical protein